MAEGCVLYRLIILKRLLWVGFFKPYADIHIEVLFVEIPTILFVMVCVCMCVSHILHVCYLAALSGCVFK